MHQMDRKVSAASLSLSSESIPPLNPLLRCYLFSSHLQCPPGLCPGVTFLLLLGPGLSIFFISSLPPLLPPAVPAIWYGSTRIQIHTLPAPTHTDKMCEILLGGRGERAGQAHTNHSNTQPNQPGPRLYQSHSIDSTFQAPLFSQKLPPLSRPPPALLPRLLLL